MGKVIAIPVTSERRAVELLAALRRLEAGDPVSFPAAGGPRRRITSARRHGLESGEETGE